MKNDIVTEQWVQISWYVFESNLHTTLQSKQDSLVHSIEIPRYMLERWSWLIDWRTAKYKYLNPRKKVIHYYSYFDKKTGLDMAYDSLLTKYISAKAQVTKVKNAIEKYKKHISTTLFQDIENDPIYKQLICKLNDKQEKLKSLEIELENTIKTTEPYTQPLRN